MKKEDVGEYVLCRIGLACLSKIARASGSPKSSEPADENDYNDDMKLTHVSVDQLVFYNTQIYSSESSVAFSIDTVS
jgi:hypothetical protein